MSAIFTNKFRYLTANLFYDQIKSMNAVDGVLKNLYLFIGRSKPWDAPYSDDYPPLPNPNISAEYEAHTDILALKKVDASSNVSLVIPRYDWVSGVCYVAYDDTDQNLYNHPSEDDLAYVSSLPPSSQFVPGSFYVLTSNWEIYVCIQTGRGEFGLSGKSSLSTVMPTGGPSAASTNYVVGPLADGYVWKYLYTLSQTEISRYVTDSWIPVKFLEAADSSDQWQIQESASDGVLAGAVDDPGTAVVWYGSSSVYGKPSNAGVTNLTSNSISINIANLQGPATSTDNDIFIDSVLVAITGTTVAMYNIASSAYSAPNHTITIDGTFSGVSLPSTEFYIAPKVVVSGIYSTSPVVRAIIDPSTNLIDSLAIVDSGEGIKQTFLKFYGKNTSDTGLLESVVARLIIPPVGGHGANPVTELGGWYVQIGVKLNNAEGIDDDGYYDFPVINDYRRVGLISNVRDYDDTEYLQDITVRGCWTMVVDNVPTTNLFEPDESITVLTEPEKMAYVIETKAIGNGTNPGTSKLRLKYYQNSITGVVPFVAGDIITGMESLITGAVESLIPPEQKPYSGDLLFIDQTKAIIRRIEQQEQIFITIEF